MENKIKYIARFKVETQTPLGIGTGRSGLLNERLIARDANGLPYIPGTALAGIVRHELEKEGQTVNYLFGFQTPREKEGQGSRIVFSSGLLVAYDNQSVIEGLQQVDYSHIYYSSFRRKNLPQRDHVRISHRGVAEKTGKFEEELVYKGARFAFEIEIEGTEEDEKIWDKILSILNHPSFRIGAGTRKGFGQLKVLSCHTRRFNLERKEDLLAYLGKSSSLNSDITDWNTYHNEDKQAINWLHYEIRLKPESFFLFGSGLWDEKADLTPKKEKCFVWEDGKEPELKSYYLIPATSIKGAISHRVAYYYNDLNKTSIEAEIEKNVPLEFDIEGALQKMTDDQLPSRIDQLNYAADSIEWKKLEAKIEALGANQSDSWQIYKDFLEQNSDDKLFKNLSVGENNDAVKTLFGYAKTGDDGANGSVIFSDLFLEIKEESVKYFNHVSIDRFTGGARDGALFTQEVVASTNVFTMDIFVEPTAFSDKIVKLAFEEAIEDLTKGNLQLGGSSAKGHGVFTGNWKPKNANDHA